MALLIIFGYKMKFLYLTDTHIRGKNPINRIDNYYKSIMIKIQEILNIAKKEKVDFIIHGGDVFDTVITSNIIVDELIDSIEKINIPFYIVPGNHDMIGHNWELSKAGSVAHIIRRSSMIHKLDNIKEDGVFIQGFCYDHGLENQINRGLLYNRKNKFRVKIAVIHAMIVLNPFNYNILHSLIKDIKTNFNLILVGHNHCQHSVQEIGGVKYLFLGCIGRISINEASIIPSCVIIDTDPLKTRFYPLKKAKPGSKIFNLEKNVKMKAYQQEMEDFIRSLENIKIQSLNIKGVIENVAKERKISKMVVKEAIKRIEENEDNIKKIER